MEKEIAKLLNDISEQTKTGYAMFDAGNVGSAIMGFKIERGCSQIASSLYAVANAIEHLARNTDPIIKGYNKKITPPHI